jgi:hypothetical protein
MNRRELLTGLAAIVPAATVKTSEPKPVPEKRAPAQVQVTCLLTLDTRLIAEAVVPHLPVHRGVAKVELPER